LLHRVEWLWQFHKVHHSVEEMGFAAHLRYHWMETIVYRTIEYIPLALLGIGLYDFFIIHIFALAIGHYNHSNFRIDGKITGSIVGFLIGIVMAVGLADINLLLDSGIVIKIATIAGTTIAGYFILGPFMKKIFNSPEMHIWHHAYELPANRKYGINFGISLAIWDYIFGTAEIPYDGRDIKLGFPGVEKFPDSFTGQMAYGIKE
jgi:sterol desaturase/sphingolipid hydroxylase (fatty acid hydroxylase superfamily)